MKFEGTLMISRWITMTLWVGIGLVVLSAPVHAKKKPVKDPQGIDYRYTEKEIGSVHFFPVENARWNGYEVRAKDWERLTDFQKMRFLQDARTEIEVHENSVVRVPPMDRQLAAMNESLKLVVEDPKLKEASVMKFYYLMLEQQGAIRRSSEILPSPQAKK